MAQIYLNTSAAASSSSLPGLAKDLFINMSSAKPGNENHNTMTSFMGSAVVSFAHQMKLGATSLLNIMHRPTMSSSSATNSINMGTVKVMKIEDPSQQIEDDYVYIFYVLLMINLMAMIPKWLKYLSRTRAANNENKLHQDDKQKIMNEEKQAQIHSKLLKTYLPAYLLATAADWLQGPYKYALYSSYGYTQRDIAHLFVAGYGSG